MSEYDLKLLPREDSFDFLAKTLTNGPFGKYAQKALELATSSPDEFRVMLKLSFKNFPQYCVSWGRWHRENGAEMINALQAEVGEITQPEPAPAQPDETVSEADAEANKAIDISIT
ncbi:internal head protein [Escherichia coli]|uniref:Internal head protein n=1 Tax=Escherichia coli TaxID=562 RepID=A0A376YK33_ECOLX|nr:internal head protein [Escherichia coli]